MNLKYRETTRLKETAAMLREEVSAQIRIREIYHQHFREELQKRCDAEMEIELMKLKRNPDRKGFSTRGRPKKVVAKEVLSDDESAQPNLPHDSLVEND